LREVEGRGTEKERKREGKRHFAFKAKYTLRAKEVQTSQSESTPPGM
jgi:hypothetical protein